MKAEVLKFMQATGNFKEIDSKGVFFAELSKLMPLLQEELTELSDACELLDVKEALDGYVDLKVYLIQLESLLSRFGCDTKCAEDAVAENNSLKYTTSEILAEDWWAGHNSSNLPWDNPYYVDDNEVEGTTYYCLKHRNTDKVSKYVDFPKVDLGKFVPSYK